MRREKERIESGRGARWSRGFPIVVALFSLATWLADTGVTQSRIGPPVPDASCAITPAPNDFVTVAITRLVEWGGTKIDGGFSCGFLSGCHWDFGDFYARVNINNGVEGRAGPGSCKDGIDNDNDSLVDLADPDCNGVTLNSRKQRIEGAPVDCGGIFVGCILDPDYVIEKEYGPTKLWRFTQAVPPTKSPVTINIQIWDADGPPDRDDMADLKPGAGKDLTLMFDPNTGQVSGDANSPQACTSAFDRFGRNDTNPVQICFEVSSLPDSDGDGLFDVWETCGLDLDGKEPIDVDFAALRTDARYKDLADPQHKDLFLELDWVPGQEPSQSAIKKLKAAFALAPIECWDDGVGTRE